MKNKQLTLTALYGLILLYWLTRLIALDSLAFFIDEANHLWWARWAWSLHPFLAASSDGRLLNVLWMAAFWPFNAGVWLSRASVILVTTAGFACVLAFARREFSARAAIIAGLLYTFLPLTFFFERMALADSISAPFVAGALWASSRMKSAPTSKAGILWAGLGGIALTAAVFSKISNLIFLCIPIFAFLFLFLLTQWRKGATAASAMLAACAATLLPSAWFVKVFGHFDLGLDLLTLKTQIPLSALPAQIVDATRLVLAYTAAYLPFPMWLLVLIGVAAALGRGRVAWFIASVLFATVGALIARTSPGYLESRFLPAYAPLFIVLAAAGLDRLAAHWRPVWLAIGAIALIGSGAVFAWQGWTHPENLSLPDRDRWQYITGWPSGYGFREIAQDAIARGERVQLVTIDLGGQERFEGYLFGHTELVTAKQYTTGMSLDGSLFVVDWPKDKEDLAALNLKLIEITRYPRPGGESELIVYCARP